MYIYIYIYIYSQWQWGTCLCTCVHESGVWHNRLVCTHARTHAHTHTRTHARTHIHTHSHHSGRRRDRLLAVIKYMYNNICLPVCLSLSLSLCLCLSLPPPLTLPPLITSCCHKPVQFHALFIWLQIAVVHQAVCGLRWPCAVGGAMSMSLQ